MRSSILLLSIPVVVLFASIASSNDGHSVVIDGWGAVHDPDGDCEVVVGKDKVTITVPDTPHDMNPDRGPANAPRILRKIKGDFTVRVRVTGEFKLGRKTTNPRSVPFIGAGLVLWSDNKNHVRLERNLWLRPATELHCFAPLFQVFKDGVDQPTNPPVATGDFFIGKSTCLKLERRDDLITASYSHDGDVWTVAKRIELELPETLHVGISASNTSNRPFRVEFDEYKLKSKKKQYGKP